MESLQKIGNSTVLFFFKTMVCIHESVTSLAIFLNFSFFSTYLLLWLVCGLLGAVIYKTMAKGPANPFGKTEEERSTFWLIVFSGPFGCVMAVVSTIPYFSKEKETLFENYDVTHIKTKEKVSTPEMTEETVEKLRNVM